MKMNTCFHRTGLYVAVALLSGAYGEKFAIAYEITTHAAITQKAWVRALAEDSALLDRLDLRDDTDAFRVHTRDYHDAGADGARLRRG
ncbi:MAG: hypothetical protein ACKVQA_03190 [Burkholderiales bacterium]